MKTRFKQNQGIETSKVGDRVVLYEEATGRAIVLNPAGAILWPLMSEPITAELLSKELCEAVSGLPEAQAEADVAAYLQQMLDQKLISEH